MQWLWPCTLLHVTPVLLKIEVLIYTLLGTRVPLQRTHSRTHITDFILSFSIVCISVVHSTLTLICAIIMKWIDSYQNVLD
jgi:hypothetical protein